MSNNWNKKRQCPTRHVAFRDIKGKVQLRHLMASILFEREGHESDKEKFEINANRDF